MQPAAEAVDSIVESGPLIAEERYAVKDFVQVIGSTRGPRPRTYLVVRLRRSMIARRRSSGGNLLRSKSSKVECAWHILVQKYWLRQLPRLELIDSLYPASS